MDNQQCPESGLRELALFAGAGGGILGGKLIGWQTVCAVERDPYAASVLVARQNDGVLPPFPIWDDVCTFDGKPWRGLVDVVSGGFPCQDISAAGKGAGITGERSGLWREMARIIREVGPQYVFVENSPVLTSRGLGVVLGDLAALGYHARWGVLGAVDAGAPHKRERIWIVAHSNGRDAECRQSQRPRVWTTEVSERPDDNLSRSGERLADVADSNVPQCQGARQSGRGNQEHTELVPLSTWWRHDPAEIPESGVDRMADGVASRVDRLKAIGNGQVPSVVRLAWETLYR